MAEYAGLEIRIGGNTTKLNNALKASTKSAAELQRNIRQITRAMQFDPTSLKNVETRIRITGDRMQSLQSKAQLVSEAMRQLGDSTVRLGGQNRSVRDIADSTDNLTLAAKQADEQYANMTGSLAKVYDAWNKLAKSKGIDFANDQLGIDKQTAANLMSASTSVTELRSSIAELNNERKYSRKPIITKEEVDTLLKFKSIDFHRMFERGIDLDQAIAQATDLGIAISDSAVANVRDLQVAFREAASDKEAFDKALQFEEMGTDLQRINSEAESLSQTMRWLDDSISEVSSTPWFQQNEADLRRVDASLDAVEKDMERVEDAMKLDPKNLELAARYMQDLQQKASLSEEKVELLRTELGHLDAAGAGEAAKSHQDLAKWIEESAENARVAKKELSDQQAQVKNLEQAVGDASQALRTLKRDSNMSEFSDNVLRWERDTQKLEEEMKNLERATKSAAEAQSKFDEANDRFVDADKRVTDLSNAMRRLERQYDKLYKAADKSITDGTFGPNDMAQLEAVEQQLERTRESLSQARAERKNFKKAMQEPLQINDRLQSDLSDVTSRVDHLRASVKKLEGTKEVKLFKHPESLEDEERALEDLKADLDAARAKEKERQAAYDSSAAENNLAKEAKQYQDIEQQIEEAKIQMLDAQDAMTPKSGSILNASTIKSIGMTLSATISPLLAGLGTSMVSASTDIDSAYRDMRKTVDGTEEQFEELYKHALEFSKTHVTSADQILEIEAIGGELGVATENLEAFATAISNIDVATNLDVEGAADALGHLGNIMHLTADDYEGFSNALVRLGNNGASTETEIANIAERIGSMGSIVGMSASDVLAWASSIASTGQNAEAAGTAISKTMSFFETAVAAAGGTIDANFDTINEAVQEGGDRLTVFANLVGKSADEFADAWSSDPDAAFKEVAESIESARGGLQGIADVAHMTADEFAAAWENDPTVVMEAFIKGLNDIEASGGSADKVLQGFGITSVRQKQAIEGLMQTIDGLDNNLKMSEDAWNGITDQWGKAGDAANEAAKKAEGFSGQIEIFKNIWHGALAELGEGAAPWIKMATGALGTVTEYLSNISDGAKQVIVGLGGVAFATGPLLTLVSTGITSMQNIKDWASESVTGLSAVQKAYAEAGNEGVKALTGMSYNMASTKLIAKELGTALVKSLTFAAVAAGVIALASALKKLYDQYQDHITATRGMRQALAGIGEEADITASSFDMAGSSLRELASNSRDYESRVAGLVDTIRESNDQYSTYAGTLNYYGDVVRDLAGKEGRTEEESAKLRSALEGINEACGTTYAIDEYGNIIDTQTGKIQDNTDVILANIDARRNQALMEYYSDDYAKAVEQMTDAQDKLNEATDYYTHLASDEGKQEYINHAKEVYGAQYDATKIQEAYNKELADAETAMNNYSREAYATEEAVTALEGKMGKAQEEMDKANQTLAEAAAAEEEYNQRTETVTADVTGNMKKLSDAVTEVGGDDAGFNAIAEGLDAVHVSAGELNDVDMSDLASAFTDANGSMQDVIQTLEDGGVHMDTWNAALEQAPGAAENMSSLTAAAFQSMYTMAGNNINDTMTLIAGLDTEMAEVDGQQVTFYIGDNGSITDSTGKVYDLKKDMDSLPKQVVTKVKGDNSDAQKKVKQTNAELDKTGKKTANPKITATDYASAKADSVRRTLDRLNGKTATTYIDTVHREKRAQATGGMNSRPVIPEHATGYIATGPTLTNQGWIGEDGIEAVANWATGGAVVPLTNKRYMLPIADAIADGMSKRMGGVSNAAPQITVSVTGVSGPDEVADAIARRLSILNF